MPGLIASDIPSKVPSLADVLLCAANPEATPLVTRMKKGKALTQMKHTIYVELKPTRKTDGATDGEDVSNYEAGGQRFEYDIRAQEFRRTPKVGQQTQDIVTDSTINDQFATLKLKLGKELWKDVESAMLSDRASSADQGTPGNGSKMAGLGDRLKTSAGTQADLPIPVEVRLPVAQNYAGALSSYVESNLTDQMEARFNACGVSTELVLLCGTKLQRLFDNFENYVPTVTNFTAVLRTMHQGTVEQTLKRGIRYYEGSFGAVEVQVDLFMPDAYRGDLLDFDHLTMHPHGKMVDFKPLPDLGGGPRGLLKATLAYSPGDVRAHCAIVGTA